MPDSGGKLAIFALLNARSSSVRPRPPIPEMGFARVITHPVEIFLTLKSHYRIAATWHCGYVGRRERFCGYAGRRERLCGDVGRRANRQVCPIKKKHLRKRARPRKGYPIPTASKINHLRKNF